MRAFIYEKRNWLFSSSRPVIFNWQAFHSAPRLNFLTHLTEFPTRFSHPRSYYRKRVASRSKNNDGISREMQIGRMMDEIGCYSRVRSYRIYHRSIGFIHLPIVMFAGTTICRTISIRNWATTYRPSTSTAIWGTTLCGEVPHVPPVTPICLAWSREKWADKWVTGSRPRDRLSRKLSAQPADIFVFTPQLANSFIPGARLLLRDVPSFHPPTFFLSRVQLSWHYLFADNIPFFVEKG